MEYINRKPIIYVLSGKAKSGKNTAADIIQNYYNDKKCVQVSFAYYLKQYVKKITNWDGLDETKPRTLLQSLGIDLIKNKIDDKLLIRRTIEDIFVYSYFYDVIIITDARLIDEVEAIKNKFDKVITIRINRSNYDNKLSLNEKNHITETNLDNYNNFDYIIENEEIEKKILKIMEEIK